MISFIPLSFANIIEFKAAGVLQKNNKILVGFMSSENDDQSGPFRILVLTTKDGKNHVDGIVKMNPGSYAKILQPTTKTIVNQSPYMANITYLTVFTDTTLNYIPRAKDPYGWSFENYPTSEESLKAAEIYLKSALSGDKRDGPVMNARLVFNWLTKDPTNSDPLIQKALQELGILNENVTTSIDAPADDSLLMSMNFFSSSIKDLSVEIDDLKNTVKNKEVRLLQLEASLTAFQAKESAEKAKAIMDRLNNWKPDATINQNGINFNDPLRLTQSEREEESP